MVHVRLTVSHDSMVPQRQPVIYARKRHIKLNLKHQHVVSIEARYEEIGSSSLVSYLSNFLSLYQIRREIRKVPLNTNAFIVSIDPHLYTLEWRPH